MNLNSEIEDWAKIKFKDAIDNSEILKNDPSLKETTVRVLEILKLLNRPMNGETMEKLPFINEGRTNAPFSKIFNYLFDSNELSPLNYIVKIIEYVKNNGSLTDNDEDIYALAGEVGRSYRAFASFLRERDLENKIKDTPFAKSHHLGFEHNPDIDVKQHTDLLLTCNNRKYRIWSYLTTYNKGLDNTATRIRGEKLNWKDNETKLPSGLHFLFPIDIKSNNQSEKCNNKWIFYNSTYVENSLKTVLSDNYPIDDYSDILNKNRNELKEYIKNVHVFRVS